MGDEKLWADEMVYTEKPSEVKARLVEVAALPYARHRLWISQVLRYRTCYKVGLVAVSKSKKYVGRHLLKVFQYLPVGARTNAYSDIDILDDVFKTMSVDIDDSDVVFFARKKGGDMAANISSAYDDNIHGIPQVWFSVLYATIP